MKHLNRIVAGLLLAVSFSFVPVASTFADEQEPKAAPIQPHNDQRSIPYVDQLLVGVTPEVEPSWGKALPHAFVEELSRLAGVRLKYVQNGAGYHLLGLPKKVYEADGEAICKKIMVDQRIKGCSPNYMFQLTSATSPNDPVYVSGQQWNLGNDSPAGINAVAAWQVTAGSATTVIAIVDGGIVPHADISASRLVPGYDFITDSAVAGDGDGRDSNPADPGNWSTAANCNATSTWHGTAVTGIIGASTDNGIGIAGINQKSKLLTVRVAGKCQKGGSAADLLAGIRWAAGFSIPSVPDNANPAKVINLSLSSPVACDGIFGLQAAIDAILKKGIVVVASAGNDDGADVSQVSPASCTGVITVGSVTRFGGRGTTTIGPRIDIAAPGAAFSSASVDMILATSDSGTQGPVGDSSIVPYAGTSIAAPHVTGIVSLVQGLRPTMRPNQIAKILKATARPFPTGTGSDCTTTTCGAGMLDGAAVVAAAKARIDGGTYHTVAVKSDSTVWTWGYNGNGQLGAGTVGASASAPIQLAGLTQMATASAGAFHTVAAKQDGTVWAWGYNANGRLGDGTTVQKVAPVQIAGIGNVIEVVAGDAHTLALKADGTVWAWGYNFFGQLGAGSFDFNDRMSPVQVTGLSNIVAIAAGGKGSMALKSDGTVWVWGNYKLNMYSTTPADWTTTGGASGPVQVPGLTNVVTIAAGGDSTTGAKADVTLALTDDGSLYSWGSNDWGEQGQGTVGGYKMLPTLVTAMSGKTILNMATSGYHVVALTDDGKQWSWGLGGSGQLGDGLSGNQAGQQYAHSSSTPVASATALTSVLDIAVGNGFTMALNADMTYSGWGANTGGQLGNGTTTSQSTPVTVVGTGSTGVYTALKASATKTDIQISISSAPNPVQVGQNVTYTVGVVNAGTAVASNVRATLTLPAQATFVSADTSCTYNANAGVVTCTIASLNAASNQNFSVVAKITTAGSYSAVASAVFAGTDAAPGNNVAGSQLTVSGATISNQGDVPIPLWALGGLATALLGIGGAFGKRKSAVN